MQIKKKIKSIRRKLREKKLEEKRNSKEENIKCYRERRGLKINERGKMGKLKVQEINSVV